MADVATATEAAAAGAQLSDEELASQLVELEKKTASQAKKLGTIRGSGAASSRADFDRADGALQRALVEWRKRKSFVSQILGDVGCVSVVLFSTEKFEFELLILIFIFGLKLQTARE